ncbi:lysozyme family protein [Floricoccus penangensis]|uniref:lysozyme family protein n=1 Tax=Floricoccus penangensis TaxID=1859475 RepID=UPI00203A933B|nr:lysozyme family protein [Floricoccus penangensis]URZ87951.1 lysozyme family protein [Floricoccus penangensis]
MFKFLRRLIVLGLLVFAGLYLYNVRQNVKQVMTYKDYIQKTLNEHGVAGNNDTELALAIIYTETKGRAADVMQSSESVSGETNMIDNEQDSIKQGIITLSERLESAAKANVDVWTGVQAYNFGEGYIDYVAKNGGKNTLELSENYSKNVIAKSLGNTDGKTYRHLTPTAILFNGGKLYVNGGNIFYAREVRFNLYLIRIMDWF